MQKHENLVESDLENSKMLQNEPLVAIVAVDTAENEPLKVWGRFHSFFIRLLSAELAAQSWLRRAGCAEVAVATDRKARNLEEHNEMLSDAVSKLETVGASFES